MKHTNPDGTQFDFDRVSKDMLVGYFLMGNTTDFGNLQYEDLDDIPIIRKIIEAARIPQERKADVARELAEFTDREMLDGPFYDYPISKDDNVKFRAIVARYRRAV